MTEVGIGPEIRLAAEVAHEINRLYCKALGDDSQERWCDAAVWQKESVMRGVVFITENPESTPEMSHQSWLDHKRDEGWVYGKEKDPEKRTHPCMVPYAELPVSQRMKDALFQATVRGVLGIKAPWDW